MRQEYNQKVFPVHTHTIPPVWCAGAWQVLLTSLCGLNTKALHIYVEEMTQRLHTLASPRDARYCV